MVKITKGEGWSVMKMSSGKVCLMIVLLVKMIGQEKRRSVVDGEDKRKIISYNFIYWRIDWLIKFLFLIEVVL